MSDSAQTSLFEIAPFPRPGWALCPTTLSPYLQHPLPCVLPGTEGYSPAYLCDLDASFWTHGSMAEAEVCLLSVEERLARQGYRILAELGDLRLCALGHPRVESPITVSSETAAILDAAGLGQQDALCEMTVDQLLLIPGFGPRRFIDLLVGIESWGMRSDPAASLRVEIAETARSCLAILSGADASRATRDIRIGERLSHLPKSAGLIGLPLDVLDRAAYRTETIPMHALTRCSDALQALHVQLRGLNSQTLEQELEEIARAAVSRGHGADAVIMRLGMDGSHPMKLEAAGERLGVTRERVRQIVAKARQFSEGRIVYAPVLDRALAMVAESVPVSEGACNESWRRARLTSRPFALMSIVSAAEFAERAVDFAIDDSGGEPCAVPSTWVASEGESIVVKGVRHEAIRLSDRYGAIQIDELASRTAIALEVEVGLDEIRTAVAGLRDVSWLDENQEWLWLDGRSLKRNRIVNRMTKALSVAGRLQLADLRSALRRDPRMGGFALPSAVLAAVCGRIEWLTVQDGWVQPTAPLNFRDCLSGVELTVVGILDEFGPVMRVQDVWQVAQAEGIQHVRFWQVLAGSPAIQRHARSVYGLRGRPISASDLFEMIEETPGGWTRVLEERGRLSDGSFWIRYRVNANALRIGTLTLPSVFRNEVDGDVELLDADGERLSSVRFGNARIAGLGRAFRVLGAEEDDHVALHVRPDASTAIVMIGDSESVSDFVESLGDNSGV